MTSPATHLKRPTNRSESAMHHQTSLSHRSPEPEALASQIDALAIRMLMADRFLLNIILE